MTSTKFTHNDYTVGWVCALPKEQTAALAMLDCEHPPLPKEPNDKNTYTLGKVQGHNVVIACLPKGMYGTTPAAAVAMRMLDTFPSIKFGLMVGIGAGIPPQVRLGDVVVSTPTKQYPGVVQWDFGESVKGGHFKKIGALNNPPTELLTALSSLESKRTMTGYRIPKYLDELASKYPKLVPKYIKSDSLKDSLVSQMGVRDDRVELPTILTNIWRAIVTMFMFLSGWQTLASRSSGDRELHEQQREMQVHYGLIASGNRLIKDSVLRDNINRQMDGHVLCVEMEAAGLANEFPCLVIRGICDYADSGKTKEWQEHAAAVGAAFTKDFLSEVQVAEVCQMRDVRNLLDIKVGLDEVSQKVTHIHSVYQNKMEKEILEWLTPIDYSSVHNDTFKRRQLGTCQWLLDSEQYQTWLKTKKQTLFCPGIPGAGKTILTSVVVNDLMQMFYEDTHAGIAYVYFNYQKQDDQKVDKILASLVKQLAERQASLPQVIKDLYDRHKSSKTWPSINELSETLRFLTDTIDRVYIIIDALDECQTSGGTRSQVLDHIVDLEQNSHANLFMTSRYMPDIEEKLQGNIMKLEVRASEGDVGSYLDSRLASLSELVEKNKDLREDIRAKVIKAVDGMFLLAELHVKSFEGMFLPNQIRRALESLPTGTTAYDETYDGAMKRIESQANTKQFAKQTFAWLTCARRPLTTSELRHALAVEVGETDLDERNLPEIGDVLAVCAGLVVVDKESDIVRLAHYTTQQYFERTQGDWFPTAETDITIACVTYLSYKSFQSEPNEPWDVVYERFRSNRFYEYVVTNWGHHGRTSKTKNKQLLKFLQSDRAVDTAAKALMASEEGLKLPLDYMVNLRRKRYSKDFWQQSHSPAVKDNKRLNGLHLAAYFGLVDAASALLSNNTHYDGEDYFARTPLIWAATNGHVGAVELFLKNGADVDSRDISQRTALSMAAEKGHKSVVSLLLAIEGIDVDPRDHFGKSPLYYAARAGHIVIFNMLLSTGKVDINATSKDLQTVGSAALENGHIKIIERLLISNKFDVDFRNKNDQTLLFQAVVRQHEKIVNLLLTADEIQADLRDEFGETPLFLAVSAGFEGIAKLLVDSGKADVNTRGRDEETPLKVAARRARLFGEKGMLTVLLELGQVQVDARDVRGNTALMDAIYDNNEEVVRLLLATGKAGTSIKNQWNYTPLTWAVFMGYQSLARLLVEIGHADVDAKDGHGLTPLKRAVCRWNKPIVWLLLLHGAEFDETIRASMKPLSESSWEEIHIVMLAAMRQTETFFT